MKIQFTHKAYQTAAVDAVVDCFAGQPRSEGASYRIDPGRAAPGQLQGVMELGGEGVSNAALQISNAAVLENVQRVQRGQNLQVSAMGLVKTASAQINLDVEMETGTGKTYVYIRTMFELNRRYGWTKFIIVVPSIAIREGVYKSLEMTAEHFLQDYGKRARFFIYDSRQPHKIEGFSSDGGINVMIINVQAFNTRGADSRRIFDELDDFQSRRPIDVIRKNRPILILDEPQKMEGRATMDSLKEFAPLFALRYSATHKTSHNKVHRLDALDAYNQKLVKKIRVHGIAQRGHSGTHSYLFVESVIPGPQGLRVRVEMEEGLKGGEIKRKVRLLKKGDHLEALSNGLRQYDGYVVSEIDAIRNTVAFTNGLVFKAGEVTGDITESVLRRIQIRETIRAHFETERALFPQGIKVLSLFFIDEVAKYRDYDQNGENPHSGEYARMFEEEYRAQLDELLELEDSPWQRYVKEIQPAHTHDGYFSRDRKGLLINSKTSARGAEAGLADDVDAYDLILKDKESLLSFPEPGDDADARRRKQVRFLFSHSALREGWDNPNVFTICTLKHSDSGISRRQEVGRGMRLCVNRYGERMDNPATAHDINVLTVVANESYEDFVRGLQGDIGEGLSERPRKADKGYFTGKLLRHDQTGAELQVSEPMARQMEKYLLKNDYTDDHDLITEAYHQAKRDGLLAALPKELQDYSLSVFQLIDSVYSDAALPRPEDGRATKANVLNLENFQKKEFQDLWARINRKAAYTVDFDSQELIRKAIATLNRELRVKRLEFHVKRGEQAGELGFEDLRSGEGFVVRDQQTEYVSMTAGSTVTYDLIGEIAADAELTRRTVAAILKGLDKPVFAQFRDNPEAFIGRAATLIKEQKATVIIEHLSYDPLEERYDSKVFTSETAKMDFSKALPLKHHIYNYVFTDSQVERRFAENLDASTDVVVYAKLPNGFKIPTPVGDYNPDWAIAFEAGKVKHVFFIAETKGSLSSLQLREIEKARIECARKFFARITSEQVKYDVVDTYDTLLNLVK